MPSPLAEKKVKQSIADNIFSPLSERRGLNPRIVGAGVRVGTGVKIGFREFNAGVGVCVSTT